MVSAGALLILSAQFLYLNNKIDSVSGGDLKASVGDISDDVLSKKIDAGIEDYIQRQIEQQQKAQEASQPKDLSMSDFKNLMDDDAVNGSKDAKVTIVEFSDFECPYCGMYYENTYKQIKETYVETGKVNYIFRDFPLSFHEDAYPSALAAECLKEQKGDSAYFKLHDRMFENQDKLSYENFEKWAKEFGADGGKFKTCFDNDKYKEEIASDMKDGQSVGVQGTPAFFVNGRFLSGAQPFENFQAIIEEELNK
jgi:protein-disulfide isomerase